jgi:hypothetical protein
MSTDKQIVANQLNAQKSTGPKTPEGRAAVRLNGLKHGLTASTLVLEGEDQSEFHELLDSIEAEHQPTTPTEETIVRQIAMATWQLRRFYHIEAGFFTTRLIEKKDYLKRFRKLDPGDRLAIVVQSDCLGANALAKISLYGGRLERSIYRALHELERLRARGQAKKPNQTDLKNQTQSAKSVEQVPDLPGKQINNIPPERQTPAPVIPIDNPPHRPASIAKPTPPEADMQ